MDASLLVQKAQVKPWPDNDDDGAEDVQNRHQRRTGTFSSP